MKTTMTPKLAGLASVVALALFAGCKKQEDHSGHDHAKTNAPAADEHKGHNHGPGGHTAAPAK